MRINRANIVDYFKEEDGEAGYVGDYRTFVDYLWDSFMLLFGWLTKHWLWFLALSLFLTILAALDKPERFWWEHINRRP